MRYTTKRPAAWYEFVPSGDGDRLPQPQVAEREPVWTGLVDADGNRIYKLPDPIGFLHTKGDS